MAREAMPASRQLESMFRFAAFRCGSRANCARSQDPAEPTESAEDDDLYWRLHAMSNGQTWVRIDADAVASQWAWDIKAALLEISAHGMSDAETGAASSALLNRSLRACANGGHKTTFWERGQAIVAPAERLRSAQQGPQRVVTDAKVRYVISVSGGKDSDATLKIALNRCAPGKSSIFCDTDNEDRRCTNT